MAPESNTILYVILPFVSLLYLM